MTNQPADPWTVLKLLNWTKEHLARAGVEDPRLAAEVLLAHAMGCERIMLYARFDCQPNPEQLSTFRSLVRRAAAYEPIAYLTGDKEFYSLRFKVTPDVLVPRAETEILVTEALVHLRRLGRDGVLWDVCTGSGCVGIAAASQAPGLSVLATDISPGVIAVAAENAASHKLGDRVRCRVADLLTLPADCRDLKDFDVITGNPPYVATNQMVSETVKHEPAIALYGGRDGLDFIRRVVRGAPAFLRPGGALILEFGFGQADDVRDLLLATGGFAEPRILRDHQTIERDLVAIRK